MNKGLITKIIKKFLRGDCSDEEFAYLLYWYESFDENPSLELEEEEKEQLRRGILKRMQQNIPELKQSRRTCVFEDTDKIKRVYRRWKYAAAAVVIGIIAWGGFLYYNDHHASPQENGPKDMTGNLVTLNNKSNRIHFILLPDSSKVWLSPDSRIAYPEKFMGPDRPVSLRGEAFFEIHTDPSHPFIVTSGILVTRVLGTSFLLKAYEGSPAEVAVMTGEVSVSTRNARDRAITLSSRQKAVLDSAGELVRETTTGKGIGQRWQKVSLSFNNVSFEKVMQALDKKFDVHIHCPEEKIAGYKLNADFTHQNLTDILEMLEKSLNIHYEMESDSVISFYPNNDSL